MSAYIVRPEVIARLADRLARKAALKFAAALIDENIKSIEHRYPDTKGAAIKHFMNLSEAEYRQVIADMLTGGDIPAPNAGPGWNDDPREYDYQACEHPDYENSSASIWIKQLISEAS